MTRTKLIDIIRSAFGGVLRIDNLAEYKESYTIDDMGANTLVPYSLIAGVLPDPSPIVNANIPAGEPDVYTLSAPELASINEYNRYPNFIALIGGVEFTDILPSYTGSIGSFTDIKIQLHSDGTLNTDDTTIQFS